VEKSSSRMIATLADYQRTFSSTHGKRVLRSLMKTCGMMQPSIDMRECNPYATAFNEGKRAAVIEILQKIRVDIGKLEKEILKQPEEGDSDVFI
jgi:hypothetical protein